jgi:hypothetical protein
MARSGRPTAVRARGKVASRHRAPLLREGRKSENIYANSEFIWGMSVHWICVMQLAAPGLIALPHRKYRKELHFQNAIEGGHYGEKSKKS